MFHFAAHTQCGARHVRNDDRLFVHGETLHGAEEPGASAERAGKANDSRFVACAFDGVGGSVRGDLAAECASESLRESLANETDLSLAEILQVCADDVADGQEGMSHNERAYTVGAGIRCELEEGVPYATPFHMGDCRVYRYRAPRYLALTRDHSLANRYRDEMGPDVEVPAKIAHVVTSYAGGDIPSPFEIGQKEELLEGDIYLCASDGLWEHVDEGLVEGFISLADPKSEESLMVALRNICRSACENGSPDDISGVLVSYSAKE